MLKTGSAFTGKPSDHVMEVLLTLSIILMVYLLYWKHALKHFLNSIFLPWSGFLKHRKKSWFGRPQRILLHNQKMKQHP